MKMVRIPRYIASFSLSKYKLLYILVVLFLHYSEKSIPIVLQTINKLPSSIRNDQTPHEQLFGSSISH